MSTIILLHSCLLIHLVTGLRHNNRIGRLEMAAAQSERDLIPLTVGGLFPLTAKKHLNPLGIEAQVAANIALADIARHPTLLKGYNLSILTKDTQCLASVGTKSFFHLMRSQETVLFLFGDACTEVNEAVATASKHWHRIQLSYAETHPKFTRDPDDAVAKFPMFYNLVPGEKQLNEARYHLIKEFDWSRIGTVFQSDEPRYALVHEAFTQELEQKTYAKIITTQSISKQLQSMTPLIKMLKAKDARIIVGDFDKISAVKIFCKASYLNVDGGASVWILAGFHDDAWWRKIPSNSRPCSISRLRSSLEGHFIVEFPRLRSDSNNTDAGRTSKNYSEYFSQICSKIKGCDIGTFHGYAYDGVWILANALDKFINSMDSKELPFIPNEYFNSTITGIENRVVNWTATIQKLIDSMEFDGITGQVVFRQNKRQGLIRIAQFQSHRYVDIGEYNAATSSFILEKSRIDWGPGRRVPRDRVEIILRRRYLNMIIFIIFCSFTIIGMLLALVFLTINVYFRKHVSIRMSSPNLNNMIILGCAFTYTSVILLGLDTRELAPSQLEIVCNIKPWLLCFGFTIAFGSMFSKTWRVYSIFTNIKLNKKAIKDYQLFLLVFCLLIVDTVILSLWMTFTPMHFDIRNLTIEPDPTTQNVLIQPQVEYCDSKYAGAFQAIIFCYKGLLLVLGVYLAWHTRHVKVPALNDSKYIGMSVYMIVIMCSVGVPLLFILKHEIDHSFIVASAFINISTTFTLLLVFVPKVVELIRNPSSIDRHGYRAKLASVSYAGPIFATSTTKAEKSCSTQSSGKKCRKPNANSLATLERQNEELMQLLNSKNEELAFLIKELADIGCDDYVDAGSMQIDSNMPSHTSTNIHQLWDDAGDLIFTNESAANGSISSALLKRLPDRYSLGIFPCPSITSDTYNHAFSETTSLLFENQISKPFIMGHSADLEQCFAPSLSRVETHAATDDSIPLRAFSENDSAVHKDHNSPALHYIDSILSDDIIEHLSHDIKSVIPVVAAYTDYQNTGYFNRPFSRNMRPNITSVSSSSEDVTNNLVPLSDPDLTASVV